MRDSLTDVKSIYPVKYVHYYPTEINAIDGLLNGGGIWPREFTFLCGRAGIGKTAVAAQIASNMAFCGVHVLYIDLECNMITLAFLAAEAEADESIDEHLEVHYEIPAKIDAIARAVERSKADVVIIDYIQLLDMTPAQTWEDVVRILPRDKAYIIVSQISREADEREYHFPVLGDLTSRLRFRVEPNATIMLYRDSYYEEVEASEMEAFVYRGEVIRGHGHWEWTPMPFLEPYIKARNAQDETDEEEEKA